VQSVPGARAERHPVRADLVVPPLPRVLRRLGSAGEGVRERAMVRLPCKFYPIVLVKSPVDP